MPSSILLLHEILIPTRVCDVIIPALKAHGIKQLEIDRMMIDNPRRYFAQTPPPRLTNPQCAAARGGAERA